MDDADEPTCIVNMLEEFRANAKQYHRSSMLPLSIFENNSAASSSKPKRLIFEDSAKSEISDKRQKLETPQMKALANEVMSPWEIRRIKSEVLKSRTQVIEAEERITKLETLNMEMGIRYNEEKKALKFNLDEERAKVKELEARLSFIRKREAEAVERYNQLKLGENEKENSACQLLSQLQNENHILKEKIFELENEAENKRKQENNEMQKLQSDLETLREKDKMNTELVEDLRKDLIEKNRELRKLEMEQSKLLGVMKRVKDLESEREAYEETRAYVESQNRKLMQYPELLKELAEVKEENQRLKSSITNTLYLETVVDDLKNRQKFMDELNQNMIKLQTENQNQRIELEKWTNLAKHFCDPDDKITKPITLLKKKLEELVRKELLYVAENKDTEIKINRMKEKIEELEQELFKSKEQSNYLKTSCETHAANIRRLKKQLTLVSWERNDLRNLLDSCQKDMTIASDAHNSFDALQKAIDGYKERLEQIESDPTIASLAGNDTKSSIAIEREELLKREAILKEENKKLREKVQHLSDQLEYRHLKGDFDPRQTKIIHLKANPTSEAMQNYEDRLTKANEEIFKLKERIKVMEEGNVEDVTRIVEERVQTTSIKEINDLKEKNKSLEIQNQRLCEVFRKRSHDFRDAMYMLFGYKVDVLPNNQYRLCSLYAFDPQDILLFQTSQANGAMELLETPYSQTLNEFIDLHLKQHKSIPLFLASLTVDLFNKQTITSFSTTVEMSTCDH